jgi:hypothetical protein
MQRVCPLRWLRNCLCSWRCFAILRQPKRIFRGLASVLGQGVLSYTTALLDVYKAGRMDTGRRMVRSGTTITPIPVQELFAWAVRNRSPVVECKHHRRPASSAYSSVRSYFFQKLVIELESKKLISAYCLSRPDREETAAVSSQVCHDLLIGRGQVHRFAKRLRPI